MAGHIAAVVLAGGRSARMGRDKRGTLAGGKPMLFTALDVVGEIASELILSCRREDPPDPALYERRAVRLVFDERDGGPLAGLEAALRAMNAEIALVVPVDMPELTAGDLARLIAAAEATPEALAVVFGRGLRESSVGPGTGPEIVPLPAVYRRSALPILSSQLDAGRFRMRDLLARLDTVVVPAATGLLGNLNTPEELRAYDESLACAGETPAGDAPAGDAPAGDEA